MFLPTTTTKKFLATKQQNQILKSLHTINSKIVPLTQSSGSIPDHEGIKSKNKKKKQNKNKKKKAYKLFLVHVESSSFYSMKLVQTTEELD